MQTDVLHTKSKCSECRQVDCGYVRGVHDVLLRVVQRLLHQCRDPFQRDLREHRFRHLVPETDYNNQCSLDLFGMVSCDRRGSKWHNCWDKDALQYGCK